MSIDEALEVILDHFPPAKNLQEAGDFKSITELYTLMCQYCGEDLKMKEVSNLLMQHYKTEPMEAVVMVLVK